MKQRVSDYIADFFAEHNIQHIFTVVGGGAMHLNDAFGHCKALNCVYCHHEQACSIAAEGYYRVNNRIAGVCVTTGPGGTNAITGVVGAWLDGIPMFVISGQVRYETTARSTGLPLRALGDQEFDITKAVSCMTKYCEMITDANRIRFALEKALYEAFSGRPGPVWLDIPLDVQGAIIETDGLEAFVVPISAPIAYQDKFDEIVRMLQTSQRPVLNAGSAIRTSGAKAAFDTLVDLLKIPVVTGWNSIDLIADDHPLYCGRAGIMGDRAGNFAIQNSDFLLSLGSRLSIRQVGYNFKSWAREAYVVDVDIDEAELQKPTIHVDMPICADVKAFIEDFVNYLQNKPTTAFDAWVQQCGLWKQKYPVVLPEYYTSDIINVYAFIKKLSDKLASEQVTVVGNGSACVVGSSAFTIQSKSRFLINSAIASMGYDLPAAIGAAFANNGNAIICITGDGSIQMNLQELQTIVHHKLPIKIFLINNGGYHSIRQTQSKFFGGEFVGIGEDSGDLSFPDFEKIAYAYGIPYRRIAKTGEIDDAVTEALCSDGAFVTEVVVSRTQDFRPKAASKMNANGEFYSAPLEDLYPFLSDAELKSNMYIPLIEE